MATCKTPLYGNDLTRDNGNDDISSGLSVIPPNRSLLFKVRLVELLHEQANDILRWDQSHNVIIKYVQWLRERQWQLDIDKLFWQSCGKILARRLNFHQVPYRMSFS